MNESLRILTQKIPKIPTIPPVADKILQLINSNAADINSIVETIEKDPAISAKVIGFSNAAFYRMGNPVTNIQDALMKIGFDNIKSIALGISLLTIFRTRHNGHTSDYGNIIRHSVAVGVVAKDIADALEWSGSEDVFTNGLLHDLGLLVMYVFYPEIYQQVISNVKKGMTFAEAEKEACGVNHAEIGAWLADKWNLPDSICEVIRYHHTPLQAGPKGSVTAIVHLADIIAIRKGFSPTETKGYEWPLDCEVLKILGISEQKISQIGSMVDEVVDSMGQMWT